MSPALADPERADTDDSLLLPRPPAWRIPQVGESRLTGGGAVEARRGARGGGRGLRPISPQRGPTMVQSVGLMAGPDGVVKVPFVRTPAKSMYQTT